MPPAALNRIVTALAVAIIGVPVLGVTAIVAAPSSPPASAITPAHTNIGLRTIHWSGRSWLVSSSAQNGPEGPHTLSDSTDAVWVDSRDRLHMKLTKVSGTWRGVQLEMLDQLNYGRYRFVTGSPVGRLAKPGVLGMFIYKSSPVKYTNEIDLEDSRALHKNSNRLDAQYVVQPYFKAHHLHRYPIHERYKVVTHQFTWNPGKVNFITRVGTGKHGKVLGHFRFKGYDVPAPANEHVYINFHLHPNRPPGKGTRRVILKAFTYRGP